MKNDKGEIGLVGALVTLGDGAIRAKIVSVDKTNDTATIVLCAPHEDSKTGTHYYTGYHETMKLNLLHYLH